MEKEQPLISIVMPVYNAEDTVERAIQSVQKQTCSNWELLAVDDGSSDRSGAICDSCAEKDPRIRVFHTPNAGVSHARNTALQAARGEWIAFLDSDDWYEPAFLQTMLAHAGHADMVICMARVMPNGETRALDDSVIREYGLSGENALTCFIRNKSMILTYHVWDKLIRKTKIHINFNSQFSYGEDTLFVLENMRSIQNINVIPECLYNYTYLPKLSLSKKLHLNAIMFLQKEFEIIESQLLQDKLAIQMAAQNYSEEICNYFLKLVSVKEKSRQDKLLVMGLQINETLFRPSAPYGVQCHGVYRLLWRALRTEKPAWIYFVFCVFGKSYMGIQHMQYQIRRRHARK